ncbi:hypothetical protein HDU76_002192 [Blyttiomyces sp. JEL0837]|nr:hypothetical protein HDU76_002192 [Blyttiomyces sp. JEL0837]
MKKVESAFMAHSREDLVPVILIQLGQKKPSTFKSTRTERAKFEQRPEDFMDEEDMEEADAERVLKASEDYRLSSNSDRRLLREREILSVVREDPHSILNEQLAEDLIAPANDSVGIRLLRRMGWKDGQEIGQHLVSEMRDISLIIRDARSGVAGLGYAIPSEFTLPSKKPVKEVESISGFKGGFGTGVLDDEEYYEIYGHHDQSSSLYDSAITDDNDIRLQGFDNNKKRTTLAGGGSGTDGATFYTATQNASTSIWYDAPKPPIGFIPKSRNVVPSEAAKLGAGNQSQLNAESRRQVLGEEELKGPARSVFSFMSEKEQNRLQSFLNNSAVQTKKEEVKTLEKQAALAALKGFPPYSKDPAKQERYTHYLKLAAGLTTDTVKHPPATQPEAKVGSSARKVEQFRPCKLLCKRFNLRDPYLDKPKDSGAQSNVKEVLNQDTMVALQQMMDGPKAEHQEALKEETTLVGEEDDSEISRPGLDLFRAIFADSDEEDQVDETHSIKIKSSVNEASPTANKDTISSSKPMNEEHGDDDLNSVIKTKPDRRRPRASDFI